MTSSSWRPKGIDDLEAAAWEALRCSGNICVTAGPGAGKTEFLAQKVAFVLETDLCPTPRRILAISFKKDAAENLAARVRERCSDKFSDRFDSMTFDAFTKSLVDRFQLALPSQWRLRDDYDIINFTDNHYRAFLNELRDKHPSHAASIEAIQIRQLQYQMLSKYKITTEQPKTLHEYLCNQWLDKAVKGNVDFLVINRIAEFLLRCNSRIANALGLTYKFVLVDEFQDTTYAQYDFLVTLLSRMQAKITVVGDNKQRIMTWAGAKPDSFANFAKDFSASQIQLRMNYRSSPGLVKIHHILAQSLDPAYQPSRSAVASQVDRDIAEVWNFARPSFEVDFLAEWIDSDMRSRKLAPTDYAILVRQKPDEMHASISNAFGKKGLLVCNESQRFGKLSLQDIVADELFIFFASIFRTSVQDGAPTAWATVSQCMEYFFPVDLDTQKPKRRHLLDRLIDGKIRPKLKTMVVSAQVIDECLAAIVGSIGEDTIRGAFPQHYSAANFKMFLEACRDYLVFCAKESTNWLEYVNHVERVNQVPLLTVHKSKGLEYDTVIFMGLDDGSWWSYSTLNPEGKATFFVGLSRAKQRVIFTYARGEGGRNKISELYQLLAAAGVPERTIA